jgi:predicted small metal-binding protein
MSRILECGSVVPGCRFIIHADTDDELMMKALAHARAEHGIEHVSEQLKARMMAAVKDDKGRRAAPYGP